MRLTAFIVGLFAAAFTVGSLLALWFTKPHSRDAILYRIAGYGIGTFFVMLYISSGLEG